MSFQAPITIAQALDGIEQRRYLLPGIQREFVWSPQQVEQLFDSIMQGYPIGSFLFWQVKGENVAEYQFYEFIRNYHERDRKNNEKASVLGYSGLTAILDGQQRLTSLYLGTHGTYTWRTRYRAVYPERRLYLDLIEDDDDWDGGYRFRFLTADEVATDAIRWFRVGDVLDFNSIPDIMRHLKAIGLHEVDHASEAIFRLYEMVRVRPMINYYSEERQDLDQVLNIFIRVNSGGTPLSYSDLLLSVASAQWVDVDAREAINATVTRLNAVGEGFRFDRDFVLKSCLVLSGIPSVAFKVTNFTKENMAIIERMWPAISESLYLAAELVAGFGLNGQSLTSSNSVIPIAHYILARQKPAAFVTAETYRNDRAVIRRWLLSALLKGTFGSQGDTVLAMMRSVIADNQEGFPAAQINERLAGMFKSIRFSPDEVQALLDSRYGQRQTGQILALLYPGVDYRLSYHHDHLHPRSRFGLRQLAAAGIDDADARWMASHADDMANLAVLEDWENLEKTDRPLADWLEGKDGDRRDRAMSRHRVPSDVPLAISGFREFLAARRSALANELEAMLGAGESTHQPAEVSEDRVFSTAVEKSADTALDDGAALLESPAPAPSPDSVLAKEVLEPLQARAQELLVGIARQRGVITYGQLASLLGMDLDDSPARNALSEVLKDVSEAEATALRPMLTAIVVQAESQVPGSGFYALAQLLGRMAPGEDPDAFAFREMRAVWNQWAGSLES